MLAFGAAFLSGFYFAGLFLTIAGAVLMGSLASTKEAETAEGSNTVNPVSARGSTGLRSWLGRSFFFALIGLFVFFAAFVVLTPA